MKLQKPVALIKAPCNLGLRPLFEGHEPGTWRAPEILDDAGIRRVVEPASVVELVRPKYSVEAQPGTRIRNGPELRRFNLELSQHVSRAISLGQFPLIVGGDCSTLLGALAGARQHERLGLVHLDGHSDFRHPGNQDPSAGLLAAAGMDLALATGRGEPILTSWPRIDGPLVADADVIQLGERESRDPSFPWPDIRDTGISCIDIFKIRELGMTEVLKHTREIFHRNGLRYWLHLDLDVLDQSFLPAVDSPGSPGLRPDELIEALRSLLSDRCAGLTMTIFDPDLDATGEYAKEVVDILREVWL